MKRADRVAAVSLLFFASYVIVQGLAYKYWKETAPGPGFVPFWLGVILAVCSVLLLLGTLSPSANNAPWLPDARMAKQIGFVVGVSVVTTLLTYVIGMVLASGLYMAAVLFYLEPDKKKLNTVISILTPVLVWLLFWVWLRVPMPKSPLGF